MGEGEGIEQRKFAGPVVLLPALPRGFSRTGKAKLRERKDGSNVHIDKHPLSTLGQVFFPI